ncbi:MAG: hypothetical protein GX222_04165 [Ruminococcaceae bacterium]|nr:hypothetical protein [Oscillospiraceae bacterium]
MDKIPVFIDMDPGAEDALAVMICAAHNCEIVGMSASYGSVSLKDSLENLKQLAELFSVDCSISRGANRPLVSATERDEDLKESHLKSWDAINDYVKENPGKLTLLTTGPLTDIAIFALRYPESVQLVNKLVVSGGSMGFGDVTPTAEFNIFADPHAASIVLDAGFKEILMVDLVGASTGFLTELEADRLLIVKSKAGQLLEAIRLYQKRLQKNDATGRHLDDRVIFKDAVAAAVAADETIAEIKRRFVFCETQSDKNKGRTVSDKNSRFGQKPNVSIVESVDREKFADMFLSSIVFFEKEESDE